MAEDTPSQVRKWRQEARNPPGNNLAMIGRYKEVCLLIADTFEKGMEPERNLLFQAHVLHSDLIFQGEAWRMYAARTG